MSTQSDEIAPPKNNARKKQRVNTSNNDDDISFLDLYDHIRVAILNYLGETQDELITLTLVSKQVYEDCKQPGIEWKIIPTIEVRPRKQKQGGSTLALLQQLRNHHVMDNETNEKIRRYHHMKVNDVHKFDPMNSHQEWEIRKITKDFQMDRILSLDMSLSMPMDDVRMSLPIGLSYILPNLREINLSNIVGTSSSAILSHISSSCPLVEKVTCSNTTIDTFSPLSGWWYMGSASNLREIIMDDSEFSDRGNDDDDYEMPIIENNRDKNFLLYHCSNALERVSIRNAKWRSKVVPQNVLIKFVRNVPTLRWFRSDLTIENMNMLNLERPEIVLLN
jgi:hypothetical protein